MILICNYLYLTLITCKGQGYIAGEKQRGLFCVGKRGAKGHTYKIENGKMGGFPHRKNSCNCQYMTQTVLTTPIDKDLHCEYGKPYQ